MTETSRLDALEMRVAEQQRTIDDLSDGLLRQQKELDRLTARLRASDDRIAELESGLPAPGNDKPPHW
jgi:SlyX protein